VRKKAATGRDLQLDVNKVRCILFFQSTLFAVFKENILSRQLAAVTIASKAFLSLARVTARSFRKHNPDIPFYLVLTDHCDDFFDPGNEPFTVLPAEEIGIQQLEKLAFKYEQQAFSYAVTPFAIRHLLDREYSGVLFLKQETLVLDSLSPLFDRLQDYSLMLTPHFLEPPRRATPFQHELDVLRAGVYNGGVVFASRTADSRRFLSWWADHTARSCQVLVEDGFHYEQRWLDFAPGLVDRCALIRDPGVNAGHWNLTERNIRISGTRITAAGEPCRIFRFSGYDPDYPNRVTKYTPERTINSCGDAADAFSMYHRMLMAEGFMDTRHWPYAYDQFDNGTSVTAEHRKIYRELGEQADRFGNPFTTGSGTGYLDWFNRTKGVR
jgi:hypothetical protein